MNLQRYRWFRNPRGLHNAGPFRPLNVERYIRPQMGWAKLVAGSDEYADEAVRLVEHGCMPIVRIYRSDMGAMAVPDEWYSTYRAYIEAGCCWFELYNEPNLEDEWPRDADGRPVVRVTWENQEECIRPLMDNWLEWAERIIEIGGYPAFPALAGSGERERATVYWMNAFLEYLKNTYCERFMRVIGSGLWCATHPYLLNHFYQEPPGGPHHVARPYYQQSADEAGWHFEYPYDPLQQAHDRGRTVFGGTAQAPYGDTGGLIAAGEAFQQLLAHHFNAGPVPVIGTEGGITPVPRPDEAPHQPDGRYPPYNYKSHAEAIMAMWRWIVEEGPPWFFGLTLSSEIELYDAQGTVPAIERMVAAPPEIKDVPPIETGGIVTAVPEAEEAGMPVVEEPGFDLIITAPEPVPAPEEEQPVVIDLPPASAEALPQAIPADEAGDRSWLEQLDLARPPLAVPDDWLIGIEEAVGPGEAAPPEMPPTPAEVSGVEEVLLPEWPTPEIEPAVTPEAVWPPVAEGEEEPGPTEAVPPEEVSEPEVAGAEVPAWIEEAALITPAPEVVPEELPPLEPPEVPETPLEESLAGAPVVAEQIEGVEATGGEMAEIPVPVETVEEPAVQPAALPAEPVVPVVVAPPEAEAAVPAEPVGEIALQPPEPAGVPLHHWLILAPGLDPAWFFDTGQRYWQIFRPTIMTGWDMLALLPAEQPVAVTIVAKPDTVDEIEAQVRQIRPAAQIDTIIAASPGDLLVEFNWRATTGRRFG